MLDGFRVPQKKELYDILKHITNEQLDEAKSQLVKEGLTDLAPITK